MRTAIRAVNCTAMTLFLSACATTETKTVIEPVVVKTVIPVECRIDMPAKPSEKKAWTIKSTYDKGVAALEELEDLRDYTRKLEAILSKCASAPVPPTTVQK